MRTVIRTVILLLLLILAMLAFCQESWASEQGLQKALAAYTPLYLIKGGEAWYASGVFVAEDLVLSVNHAWSFGCSVYLDSKNTSKLELIYNDSGKDLALYRSPLKHKWAKLGVSKRFEEVIVVGTPVGNDEIPFFGRVVKFSPDGRQMIVDTFTMYGCSGGGIFNFRGHLVGLANLSWGDDLGRVIVGLTPQTIRIFLLEWRASK